MLRGEVSDTHAGSTLGACLQCRQRRAIGTTFFRLLGFLRPYKVRSAISIVLAIGSQAAALVAVLLTRSIVGDPPQRSPEPAAVARRRGPRPRRRCGR